LPRIELLGIEQSGLNFRQVLLACMAISMFLALPVVQASADVESRIASAIEWIRAQKVSSYSISGFIAETDRPLNSTLYLEDQALVALALSDYHSTHNDARYDDLLKVAANFIIQARTPSGRFYEYYDLNKRQWVHEGGLYSWDAYAIAALAASAYKIAFKSPEERSYWFAVEAQMKTSVINLLSNQRSDGAWMFRNYTTGRHEALTSENAVMLMGLSYIGLFEYQWGSSQQASYYGKLSEKTANWLFSTQVANSTFTNYGGFPHSDLNSTQISEENGIILLGVNSYYSIIGLLDPRASPTIWDARRVMIDWVDGFVRKMRDSYGGPYFARNSNGILEYPKTTSAASWMLQALADIWVNLGGNEYYGDSQKPYEWIVGGNELRVDLQSAASHSGPALGFYSAILPDGVHRNARTGVTASAVYAFVRAGFIQIPEFPQSAQAFVLFLGFGGALLVIRKKKRKLGM